MSAIFKVPKLSSADRHYKLERVYKQPSEKFKIVVDFADVLETGDIINSINSTVKAFDGVTDVSSTILDGSLSVSGSAISQVIKAGDDAKTYKITFTAQTDSGYIYEYDLLLIVKEV